MSGLADFLAEGSDDRKCAVITNSDGDVETYYAKPLTNKDIMWVGKKHKNFASDPCVEGLVDLLIRKTEDKDGKKALTVEDKPRLMRAPANAVGKIFGELFKDEDADDDVEKS